MKRFRSCCIALALASLPCAQDPTQAELVGLSRSQSQNSDGTTLLEITADPFSVSTIGVSGGNLRLSGLDFQFGTGTLFATSGKSGTDPGSLFTVDVNTGAAALVGSTGFAAVSGLASDSDGTLYGSANISSSQSSLSDRLITIDPLSGVGTLVGSTYGGGIEGVDGIAFDPLSGTLYGSNGADLITINKSTGLATALGALTEAGTGNDLPGVLVGLAFSPTGDLFGSIGAALNPGDRGSILSIDTGNLQFTLLGDAANGPVSDIAFHDPNTAVPEPSSFALLGVSAAGFLGWRRRRSGNAVCSD